MTSILLVASLASIIVFIIIALFIHHGIIHPEINDPAERWLDTKDLFENFQNLGASHGGIVVALSILLIGMMLK